MGFLSNRAIPAFPIYVTFWLPTSCDLIYENMTFVIFWCLLFGGFFLNLWYKQKKIICYEKQSY